MRKRMILMLLWTGLFFGGLFGFKWFVDTMINQFFDTMPIPAATITVAEVASDEWTRRIETVGGFAAVQGATLTTEVAGIIHAIEFQSGAEVTKDEVLIRLEAAVDEAEYERLQAVAELARVEYERIQHLHARESASEADLERRASEHAQALAAAQTQHERVQQKILKAPFDGRLGIRQVNLGQYISPGMPVVSLQSVTPIYLNFSLPEQRLADIRTGMEVEARTETNPGRVFTGTISAIEPEVDPATRNFRIQATFDNDDGLLRPGIFARVSLALGEPEPVVVAPQTAISFSPYGNSVFALVPLEEPTEEGAEWMVLRRFIQTGEKRGDLIAITQGLEPGDRIASSGLLKLRNEVPVIITDQAEPSAHPAPTPPNR